MFKKIFGFVSNLFGGKNSFTTKTLELIDKGKWTEQEKAELGKQVLQLRMNLSSRSRRWIAWLITIAFLVCFLAAFFTGYWDEALSSQLMNVLKISYLQEAFMAVVVMYFGKHIVNTIKQK